MDEIIQQSEVFYELGAKHERERILKTLKKAETIQDYKFVVALLSQ